MMKMKWSAVIISLMIILLFSVFFCGCGASDSVDRSSVVSVNSEVRIEEKSLSEDIKPDAARSLQTEEKKDTEKETLPDAQTEDVQPAPPEVTDTGDPEEVPAEETEIQPDTDIPAAAEQTVPEEVQVLPLSEPEATAPDEKTCTFSISCITVLDNLDRCDPDKLELIPSDGWILEPVTVTFQEGESILDVLQRICREQQIHLEFVNTPIYNSSYIEGIANLYEFDVGELSGWSYKVNDTFPGCGCNCVTLSDGDIVCIMYTCDLGSDIGGSNRGGEQDAKM